MSIAVTSDWTTVTAGVNLDYDIETTPLQIKTDSRDGSWDKIHFRFYATESTGEEISGGGILLFTDPPSYHIGGCSVHDSLTDFGTDIPDEGSTSIKIWTFTETATQFKIECNGVELLTYSFSDSARSQCLQQWSKDTAKIKFLNSDNATDEFRAKPGNRHSTFINF